MSWSSVCELEEVIPDTGVCALLQDRQVAIFRIGEAVFALDNHDPASDANVLSRGIVGDVKGEKVVASPLYKHHYSLGTGRCLEDSAYSVNVYPARIMDGRIWVNAAPQAARSRRRLAVIGNGMAGMRTVEELLKLAPHDYEITVFGAEPHGNYNRILLSPVLSGEKRVEEIILHSPQWYSEHGVTLHAGDSAVRIDRRRRVVHSRNGV
jgi:NAD(P)H-dependent nitrite reductase small subunit